MIHSGNNGSINFFFKNKLLVSRPLSEDRPIISYENSRDLIMVEALREGWGLKEQIKFHMDFIKVVRYEALKQKPTKRDLDIILCSGLILIKLKQIEADGDREGLLIMPKK